MNKWIKRIGIACLFPIVLFLLLSALLYIPAVQKLAVDESIRYMAECTGMRIGIDRVRLSFPIDLSVQGVKVIQSPDTLFSMREMTVRVSLLPLLRKQVLVEQIGLKDVLLHTGDLIEGFRIDGTLGRLRAKADRIDLSGETAVLDALELSDTDLRLFLNDTTQKVDTIAKPVNWSLKLKKITIRETAMALDMPADSLRLNAYVGYASLRDGLVNLADSLYGVTRFRISKSRLDYDKGCADAVAGFDPNHIKVEKLAIGIDSVLFHRGHIAATILDFGLKERSGIEVVSLTGRVRSDSTGVEIPGLRLLTSNSDMLLNAHVPDKSNLTETMNARLSASIGCEDLMSLIGHPLSVDAKKALPGDKIKVNMAVDANSSGLYMGKFNALLSDVFSVRITGNALRPLDNLGRSVSLNLNVDGYDMNRLWGLFPGIKNDRFTFPKGIGLTGTAKLHKGIYNTSLVLSEGKGTVKLTAGYNPLQKKYDLLLKADSVEPIHFLPQDSLYLLSAGIKLTGKEFDPFSVSMKAHVKAHASDIHYGKFMVADIDFAGSIEKNQLRAKLTSNYPPAIMELWTDITLRNKKVKGIMVADAGNLDLRILHLTKDSLTTAFQFYAEGESDLNKNNKIDLTLGNWEMKVGKGSYKPKTLTLHACSGEDSTHVSFHVGDLDLTLTGNADLETMRKRFEKISSDLTLQLKRDSMIDFAHINPLLPDMRMEIKAAKDNPIYNFLQQQDITFDNLALNAFTSPEKGLRLEAGINNLLRDTFRIDTIRFAGWGDSLGLRFNGAVAKYPYRRQSAFRGEMEGAVRGKQADAVFRYKDGRGKEGLLLGLRFSKVPEGIKLHLFPQDPIIAFLPFTLNKDNYLLLKNAKEIEADLRLTGKGDGSLWVHSESEQGGSVKALHADLSDISIDSISKGLYFLPPMRGMISANLRYAPSDSSFEVVANTHVDEFFYNGGRVGDLNFSAAYIPVGKGDHQMDMSLLHDRKEVVDMTAFYHQGKRDSVAGGIGIYLFPLHVLNPFIPGKVAKLSGALSGTIAITGQSERPKVEGYLHTDTAAVFITAAGSSFRLDKKKILLEDSLLTFHKFPIYGASENPFMIDGTLNFMNPARMRADFRMRADNMQLLDVKRNDESLVYGKLFVDLNSTVKGPLSQLVMRGDLRILGNTNMTYVLKDSPLTVQDRFTGLVNFVSFEDTLLNKHPKTPPPFIPLGGLDLLMTVRIDPAVRLKADLSDDQSSYVELEGGGDLSYQYTLQGEQVLNGRYTLSGGKMKYALPVIPLKEFNIQNGSFVQWNGELLDPTLNFTAKERVRSTVTLSGQSPRTVNFDVGIAIKQRLKDLSLQFTLEAPEDAAVQSQLDRMGAEERTKQAVSMLVTGMYLASEGSGKPNLDMGAALNSFLQSEINNIAGSALKTVDINFGIENYDDNGAKRTDYSFRFAKRFYNDRIRIVLGGRISTGEDVNQGQGQTFIDNISIEYRLDKAGSHYVKLFHNKDYKSVLEGEITETGAGLVLSRKMKYLRELFNFKKKR